jgi:hypothetical protein
VWKRRPRNGELLRVSCINLLGRLDRLDGDGFRVDAGVAVPFSTPSAQRDKLNCEEQEYQYNREYECKVEPEQSV